MASRDHLVGRPLVPFFDADESVNEALRVDHSTESMEQLDVDARVWDRDLGYFVYPEEQPAKQHSQPISIKPRATDSQTTTNDSTSSYGRALLTPDMLFSRSAPTASAHNGMVHMRQPPTLNHTVPVAIDNTVQPSTPRSVSAKRASRQKSRSGTPTRTRNNNTKQRGSPSQAATTTTTDTGGSSGSDSNDKTAKNGKASTGDATPGSAKKNRNNKKQDKTAEELSTNGKWAWSAFQSSPDPKSLPLPPFAIGGTNSPGLGALPPPKDPPKIEERWDPPVRDDRPPSLPPDVAPAQPPPSTIEHSMTQDLRRMLNIGS